MPDRKKILVVDDERFNVNILVDLLKTDYKMMVARNGKQALRAARAPNPPNLILLDIMMPEMDGYEVCRRLKADSATRDIPVIFVSGMGEETDETKGLELGSVDYITKPISPPIVRARVKTHLALKSNMEALQEAYALIESQKRRMQTELNVARTIQMGMIPIGFRRHPAIEIHAVLEPAREVGGDFYNYFFLDDETLCFCIGDVSDKGVPAALFMAMTRTLIKARARVDRSPGATITHVNNELCQDNPLSMFVTIFFAMLNVRTGELTYTNAGHNPPYLVGSSESLVRLDQRHGAAAGVMEDIDYGESQIHVAPGDLILLYTDGVTESMNRSNELFSERRLRLRLAESCDAKALEIVRQITADVRDFEDGADQTDDIAVLAVRLNPESRP